MVGPFLHRLHDIGDALRSRCFLVQRPRVPDQGSTLRKGDDLVFGEIGQYFAVEAHELPDSVPIRLARWPIRQSGRQPGTSGMGVLYLQVVEQRLDARDLIVNVGGGRNSLLGYGGWRRFLFPFVCDPLAGLHSGSGQRLRHLREFLANLFVLLLCQCLTEPLCPLRLEVRQAAQRLRRKGADPWRRVREQPRQCMD